MSGTMDSIGKTAQVTSEMQRYRISILGVSECRWSGFGRLRTQTGEIILYSGRDDDVHQSGVAIVMTRYASRCLESWSPVSDRIITARFHSKYIKTTIVQVYAPTNEAEDEAKETFYDQLQKVLDAVPRHDMLLVMGDWNAKVGVRQEGESGIVGKHGLICERNDNGDRFVSFCAWNNLAITSTMFPHKDVHKYTWTSPDGQYRNQIDHVAIRSRFKRSVQDTRAHRGADVGSDHNLVITKAQLRLNSTSKKQEGATRFEESKLREPAIRQQFQIELRNRFRILQMSDQNDMGADDQQNSEQPDQAESIDNMWQKIKTTYTETALKVLGRRKKKCKSWISTESWKKIEERRKLKKKIGDSRSERLKNKARIDYREKDKEVKRSLRKDKRDWINGVAQEAEDAASQGQMKGVYEATRRLCNEGPRKTGMVKNKEGKLLTEEGEVKARWQEHFKEVLNRPVPEVATEVEETDVVNNGIDIGEITREEIKSALGDMKSGKAPGIDSITADLLRVDTDTTIQVLHELFNKIWEEESVPEDWLRGLIIKLPKKGDLTSCENWRGITLMSVVAKVLGRVLIKRIVAGTDAELRGEQAGFRKGRNTTEQIFVLRNIIEQVAEWNSSLYLCFVDYEKAFDSIHRETLWRIMRCYGIPTKIVRMVQVMYTNCRCAVVDGDGRTDWFEVKSGVKQGCNMSGFLFLLVIDWVMRRSVEGARTGIRWKMTTMLEDLDFADDLALISSTFGQIQRKIDCLNRSGKGTGLKISTKKTKVMRINVNNNNAVLIDGQEVEDVDSFDYLGARITKHGGAEDDIKNRLGKATGAFNKLAKIWRSGELSKNTKIRIFKSNVIAVLLYGCETWRMTKRDVAKLDTFLHKCLRRLLKIYWPMKVSNEEVRRRARTCTISEQIRRRRWRWIGHVLRMNNQQNPRIALTWAPEGKRTRGRPKVTWRRTVEGERQKMGFTTWSEAATAARDRAGWRRQVKGPILPEEM